MRLKINPIKNRLRNFVDKKRVKTSLFVLASVSLGVSIIHLSIAATSTVSLEAESGVRSGDVSVVSDATASNGNAVQFGVAGSNPLAALPRIAWEGGSSYWSQFSRANAAGWDDPSFFPVTVFMGNPEHAASLFQVGINTFAPMEHRVAAITDIDNVPGMYMLPGREWTQAEIGSRANAVGWFISDECEMGYDGCGDGDQYSQLAIQQSYVTERRSYNDGRFLHANFGNGVLRTFWGPDTMDDHVQLMDSSSADKYTYTSPHIWGLVPDSPDWPAGATVATSASYGWQVDQMKRFQDPATLRPIWTFVETARPYLTEPGAQTIQPNQMEGAVWSAIIHEARGISYFQHNNDDTLGCIGTYSIVDCSSTAFGQALRAKLTAVHAKIRSLAPVINSQSYQYDFNNGTDTMLKAYGGEAYIFAGIGLLESPGDKTFTLPPGVNGTTVTVVGESRTIPVVGGSFTDNFAAEYTHHVYTVAL